MASFAQPLQLQQLVLLLLVVPCTATFALPSCFPPDLHTLRSFAASFSNSTIDGTSATLKDLWTGENCCFWIGVACTTITASQNNTITASQNNITAFLSRVSELSLRIIDPQAARNNRPSVTRNVLEPLCNLSLLSTLYLGIGNGYYAGFNTPIPACLSRLSALRSLSLPFLNLFGPIPPSFSRLHLLQNLDLSYNRFLSGSLLPLSNLPNLTSLDLSACAFAESLPPFNTPLLQFLSLTQNFLNSTLDDFTLFSTLPSLATLDLSLNSISGSVPPSIDRLPSLRSLQLSMNFISGSIPASLTRLSNLHALWLDSNSLSGPLPKSFCKLTNLVILDLEDNVLVSENDALDMECKFINLTKLLLSSNRFTGGFPRWIGHSTLLQLLYLNDNHFRGNLPEEWQNLRNLQYIDFSGNFLLSDSFTRLPDWIFRLPRVTDLALPSMGLQTVDVICSDRLAMLNQTLLLLDLSNNSLTGFDTLNCFALHNFTKPLSLSLSSNPLSISMSDVIFTPAISSLDLSSCSLEGRVTDKLLQPLEQGVPQLDLFLANNRLMGTLPTKLCNFTTLNSIHVSHNRISGFDPCVNGSVQLGVIDLSYNALDADLPSFLATMGLPLAKDCSLKPSNLWKEIDLSHNKLVGEIPSCLGLCATFLTKIKLNDNLLVGHIPYELGSLLNLRTLTLNNNHLNGTIPPSITRIGALELLDLSYNELEGDLTTLFSFSSSTSQLRVLLLGHNKINGSIPLSFGAFAPELQIIDLSHNKISGTIPHQLQLPSFQILQAGIIHTPKSGAVNAEITTTHKGVLYAEVSTVHLSKGVLYAEVPLVVKGVEQQYSYVSEVIASLDLSANHLVGEIPSELGDISGLLFLNLSYNSLSGSIPAALAKLSVLEALDLSSNKLEGVIPPDLSSLTKLGDFNVSFNGALRGSIPIGPQFENSESYRGDTQLCGFPTLQACKEANAPVEASVSRKRGPIAEWIDEWISLPGLSLGFVVGFGTTLFFLHRTTCVT